MLAVRIAPMLVIPRSRERVKKILFLCTANTYRSPMVQANFDTLAEDKGLRFRAESVGTEALEGTAIAEKKVAALEEARIYPGLHSAGW